MSPIQSDSALSLRSPLLTWSYLASWVADRRTDFYQASLPYIGFTLWFILAWLVGDFYLNVPAGIEIFRVEYPLTLYLFFVINQITHASPWRPILGLVAIFGLYVIHDVYWLSFNDIPSLIMIQEVPELFLVGDWKLKGILLGIPVMVLFFFIYWVRYTLRSLLVVLPLLILPGLMFTNPAVLVNTIEWGVAWIYPWVRVDNATFNGRFTVALYDEAKRRVAMEKLAGYGNNPIQAEYFQQLVSYLKAHRQEDRHIFVLVMESFLDARLLKPLRGRNEIIDAEFRRSYDKSWGFSISPTFAGGTARAEFEILCGVPALAEFDDVEFNLFTGNPVPCVPEVLSQIGYDSIANYPYHPSFFNAQRAYAGFGFQQAYFAAEYTNRPTYLHLDQKDQYLFDGSFFQQNRDFLSQTTRDKPIFNYLLTLYGHMYFEVQRPIRWKIEIKDPYLERIVNIGYYRSAALAEEIKWITEHYPKSLIIAIADHLPILQNDLETYAQLDYLHTVKDFGYYNRILIVQDGKPKKLPTLHHFGVPDIIYDYLTNGDYCRDFQCVTRYPYDKEQLRERYRYLLAHAAQPAS